ncbi:unnamed protein product [Boreogadus saida]
MEETTMDSNLLVSYNVTGIQNETDLHTFPDGCKILFGAMIYVIFILSIIGNTLLFHALFCHMNVKNVTDMYFFHLACSDVALTIALPFAATGLIHVDQFSTVVIQNGCIVPVKGRRCAIGACTMAWMVSLAVHTKR